MAQSANGSVGIGTSNPQAPLDVNGNVNVTGNATVSGNIAAKYQDIAEWTSGPVGLPSGSVVSLDTSKPNSVMPSNKPLDLPCRLPVSSSQSGRSRKPRSHQKTSRSTNY